MISGNSEIVPRKGKKYDDVLELALDVNEDEIIMKGGCKMCHSDFRHEAEAFWEKSNFNYNATVKFLEAKGDRISFKAVQRHLDKHYMSQLKAIRVKDYAEDLSAFMQVEEDAVKTLAMSRAVLKKEMLEFASLNSGLSLEEHRKNTELLIKIINQLTVLDESERKHHEEWGPVHVLLERLTQIVDDESVAAPVEYQERLSNVVKTLAREIEGGVLEKKKR